MLDPASTVLTAPGPEGFVRAVNTVVPRLPPEVRRRFNFIKLYYLTEFGVSGIFEQMNGRTVAQVIDEYQGPEPGVTAEGEWDCVRFTLYDPPSAGPKND